MLSALTQAFGLDPALLGGAAFTSVKNRARLSI